MELHLNKNQYFKYWPVKQTIQICLFRCQTDSLLADYLLNLKYSGQISAPCSCADSKCILVTRTIHSKKEEVFAINKSINFNKVFHKSMKYYSKSVHYLSSRLNCLCSKNILGEQDLSLQCQTQKVLVLLLLLFFFFSCNRDKIKSSPSPKTCPVVGKKWSWIKEQLGNLQPKSGQVCEENLQWYNFTRIDNSKSCFQSQRLSKHRRKLPESQPQLFREVSKKYILELVKSIF